MSEENELLSGGALVIPGKEYWGDWATRIPVAIKRAEEKLDGEAFVLIPPYCDGNKTDNTIAITATEVALADALWETWNAWLGDIRFHPATTARPEPPPALIAFTEKVEKIA